MSEELMLRTNGRPSVLAVVAAHTRWLELREVAEMCALEPQRLRYVLDKMDVVEIQERLEGDRVRIRREADLPDETRRLARRTLRHIGLL